MKILTIAMLLFAVLTSSAFATAQFPDKILYEGKEYSLHTNPMEAYFAKHPGKRPKDKVMSTALWRGYIATFAFKTDALVLKDIEIEIWNETTHETSWKSVKDDIVPKGKEFLVDWFTGILVLPHGKLVNYVHMGYGSTYSNYILLEIKKGQLTGKRVYDYKQYEEFKEKQFQTYRKTEAYKKQLAELKKERGPSSQESRDSFLRSFVMNYTSEFLDKKDESSSSVINSDKK